MFGFLREGSRHRPGGAWAILIRAGSAAGNDLEAWEQQQLAWGLDPVITFDFKLMYKFFQEQGLLAGGNDIERLGRVLGHAPRSYGAFVEETVKSWK